MRFMERMNSVDERLIKRVQRMWFMDRMRRVDDRFINRFIRRPGWQERRVRLWWLWLIWPAGWMVLAAVDEPSLWGGVVGAIGSSFVAGFFYAKRLAQLGRRSAWRERPEESKEGT